MCSSSTCVRCTTTHSGNAYIKVPSYHFLLLAPNPPVPQHKTTNLHQLDQRSTNSQKAHAPSHRIDCHCYISTNCVCINHQSFRFTFVRWKEMGRRYNPCDLIWRRITRRNCVAYYKFHDPSRGKITRANENPEGKHGGLSDAAAANWPCQTRQNLISAMVHSRRRHGTRLSESVAWLTTAQWKFPVCLFSFLLIM